MALKTIGIGKYANDGTGDDLRTAFSKINDNFEELDLQQGQNNTISNVGLGVGIYKEKVGVNLRLRSLRAGEGISIIQDVNEVEIKNIAKSIVSINANTGTLTASTTTETINILGTNGITTTAQGTTLTIAGSFTVSSDPTPVLGGNLDLNGHNITGFNSTITVGEIISPSIRSVSFKGNLEGTVYGYDVRQMYEDFYTIDFGNIVITTTPELILAISQVDFGTFNSPSELYVDGGTLV